jgi:hypothetical protein
MGRNSIVAIVGHACGQIRQFTLRRCQRVLEIHRGAEVDQRPERARVVGHGAVDVGVDRSVAVPTHRSEQLDRDWIGSRVGGVDERYSSHRWCPSRTVDVMSFPILSAYQLYPPSKRRPAPCPWFRPGNPARFAVLDQAHPTLRKMGFEPRIRAPQSTFCPPNTPQSTQFVERSTYAYLLSIPGSNSGVSIDSSTVKLLC